jgi:hypothetical protein
VHLGAVGVEVQGRAEVADLDVHRLAVVVDDGQQVGRLDVAVNQPLAEAVGQRHRALETQFDDLVERQQAVGAAEMLERHARHVLHHQIGRLVVEHRVEDLHHIGVVQTARQRGLGGEEVVAHIEQRAAAAAGLAPGPHALDRHVLAAELVVAEEDVAGGPLAQAAQHAVAPDVRGQLALRRHAAGGEAGAAGQREVGGAGLGGHGRHAATKEGGTRLLEWPA